jgi:hypothetical protein
MSRRSRPHPAGGRRARRLEQIAGQASVEVAALLPMLALAGLAVMQLLAAGVAGEYAGHAAEAGAVAIAQERDPETAVREALPAWSRRRLEVQVHGRRVRVRVRPPAVVRRVGDLLAATAEADAGPDPR